MCYVLFLFYTFMYGLSPKILFPGTPYSPLHLLPDKYPLPSFLYLINLCSSIFHNLISPLPVCILKIDKLFPLPFSLFFSIFSLSATFLHSFSLSHLLLLSFQYVNRKHSLTNLVKASQIDSEI